MIKLDTIIDQTLATRQVIVKLLKSIPVEQGDVIPPTWHNNARWHAGHLIVTPCLITYGIIKEPLPVPEKYRDWFGKGSSPAGWGDVSTLPTLEELADDIIPVSGKLFDALKDRMDEPFLQPYETTIGIVLKDLGDSMAMSAIHDGIHLGMLMALKRALQVSH